MNLYAKTALTGLGGVSRGKLSHHYAGSNSTSTAPTVWLNQ